MCPGFNSQTPVSLSPPFLVSLTHSPLRTTPPSASLCNSGFLWMPAAVYLGVSFTRFARVEGLVEFSHISRCIILQHTATPCDALQHTATDVRKSRAWSNLSHTAQQYTATHCNTPQRTATHYNTLQQRTAWETFHV